MTVTRTRMATGAAVAALGATALVAVPVATAPAQAATRVKVGSAMRAEVLRDRVLAVARSKVGHRYIWGADGPNAFDCSGLVVYSYRRATGITLPHNAAVQMHQVPRVNRVNRRPGDLVFLHGGGHVAIYIGHNTIVHASNPSRGVRYDRLSGWYGRTVDGYGRVIVGR